MITEKKKVVPLLSHAQKSTYNIEAQKLEAVLPNTLKSCLGDAVGKQRNTLEEKNIRENEDSKEWDIFCGALFS